MIEPSKGVYYNELDEYASQWLVNLVVDGHIAPGRIDSRSIKEVEPKDLNGYKQAHFFVGIGTWSYALRKAGWPDDLPVWTGSCPCQPFSAAGQQKGFSDERHLWPEWFRLIRECHPPIILGEQVASAGDWLDVVSRDLEAEGYAFGAAVLGAHSVGAPHIRQRFYFVAHSGSERLDGIDARLLGRGSQPHRAEVAWRGEVGVMEHAASEQVGLPGRARLDRITIGELAHASERRFNEQRRPAGREEGARIGRHQSDHCGNAGFWADADWIPCRDGKLRPVEPGTFPLAHGATSRVGRLRAYGNAICAETAIVFIKAVQQSLGELP